MAATSRSLRALLCGLALAAGGARAGVLPEDRGDAMYHSYNGGGVEVTGPSYLIRKGDGTNFSVSANYYVDSISSASIDVVTQGSPYDEDRTQWSGSIDYIHADTTASASYSNSDESDYDSDTWGVSLSQSMFGDLTTVTIGFSRGYDDIYDNYDPTFKKSADHYNYHVSLTQVLTRDLLLSLNYDNISDEGYLQNPYRNVLVLNDPNDPAAGTNFNTPEKYPKTRTSNAGSANLLYYLPYRATVGASYRYYDDDWGISAHTAGITYTHSFGSRWLLDLNFRYYQQGKADFYANVFQRPDQQNFMARDKELSEFKDYTLGFGLSYEVLDKGWGYLDRATLNFRYSRIWFRYDDFSDIRKSLSDEYEFDADVIQAFASIWY